MVRQAGGSGATPAGQKLSPAGVRRGIGFSASEAGRCGRGSRVEYDNLLVVRYLDIFIAWAAAHAMRNSPHLSLSKQRGAECYCTVRSGCQLLLPPRAATFPRGEVPVQSL
jgi:hypothetical protein